MIDKRMMRRLKKVLALAERGIGGEKENAKTILTRLLAKYKLSLADIMNDNDEEVIIKSYHFYKARDKKLLFQLYSKLKNVNVVTYFYGDGTFVKFKLTKLEHVELREMFTYYKQLFNEELDIIVAAFIRRHQLWSNVPSENSDEEVERDHEREMRIAMMAAGFKKSQYTPTRRRLGDGKDN